MIFARIGNDMIPMTYFTDALSLARKLGALATYEAAQK